MVAVQDVFFGKPTLVHIKRGSTVPSPAEVAAAFARLKIPTEGVRRDDTAVL